MQSPIAILYYPMLNLAPDLAVSQHVMIPGMMEEGLLTNDELATMG